MNESTHTNKNAWKLKHEGKPKISLRTKVLAGTVALGLAGSLVGEYTVGQSRIKQSQEQNIKNLEKDNATLAKQIANEQAQNITDDLGNDPGKPVPVTILKGTFVLKGKDGRPTPANSVKPTSGYEDAIILSTINGQKATSFADVAYIGVQSPGEYMNGGIAIVAKNAQDYTFVPDSKQPVEEVYVYEDTGKDGNYIYSYGPATQKTLTSSDGTPESPGLPAEVAYWP